MTHVFFGRIFRFRPDMRPIAALLNHQTLIEAKMSVTKRDDRSILENELKLLEIVFELTLQRFRAMIMDKLGLSLGTLFKQCNKMFSLKTVCMIAIQVLCRLEYMHQRSFIHRDIKPDNFVFGYGKESDLLYVIDLGLAKRYRDLTTLNHTNYAEDKDLAGTARYVSINVHAGLDQTRRDDLESVGYVLIYFLKGKLPWSDLEEGDEENRYQKTYTCKMSTQLDVLCDKLPQEFVLYMQKVRDLKFDGLSFLILSSNSLTCFGAVSEYGAGTLGSCPCTRWKAARSMS
jgi:serine/threonine protein kinase